MSEIEQLQSKYHKGCIEIGTNYIGYDERTDVITLELIKNTSFLDGKEIKNKITTKKISICFDTVLTMVESITKTMSNVKIPEPKESEVK